MMKIACPHCSQNLELDSETITALEGASHFDCPTCGGAVEVPTPVLVPAKQAPPSGEGKPAPERVARRTQQGVNRNLLVLGVVALLAIGGVAMFLASKNGGNIFNIFQNTTNQIINNSYFTQLIADGVTTEKDLDSIAEIRPYGDGFIGISKAELSWEQSQDLARRTGAGVLAIEDAAEGSMQQLIDWLNSTLKSQLSSTIWVQQGGQAKALDKHEVLGVTELDSRRKAVLQWKPNAGRTTADPSLASKDQPFENSLGMKFVPVPDTNVLFCTHEVRYQNYAAYAADSPGVDGAWKDQSADGFTLTENQENHPVMRVSWDDAQKFCSWLSKKEGKTYRLPTDEQWSYAVGIGRDEMRKKGTLPSQVTQVPNEFPWGGGFPPKAKEQAGNYSDASRKAQAPGADGHYFDTYDDGFPTTAPVMSFKPNKLGLYDLGGNVWEWCEDWYDNAQKTRVLRGGAWGNYERDHMLSSHRAHIAPFISFEYHGRCGFRVVLELGANTSKSPAASKTFDMLGDPPNTTRRVIDLIQTARLLPGLHLDTWDVKGTDLEFFKGGEIVFPHACGTQEYDLAFEFTVLTDAVNSVGHSFPTAAGRCLFTMQLFREHPGPFWGFAILDNVHYAFANEARVVKDYPALFKAGQRYQTTVKVRDGSLEGYLDGRLLVHWEGDQSRFTTGENNLPHPRYPKFGVYDGRAVIHKAIVTEFVPVKL